MNIKNIYIVFITIFFIFNNSVCFSGEIIRIKHQKSTYNKTTPLVGGSNCKERCKNCLASLDPKETRPKETTRGSIREKLTDSINWIKKIPLIPVIVVLAAGLLYTNVKLYDLKYLYNARERNFEVTWNNIDKLRRAMIISGV